MRHRRSPAVSLLVPALVLAACQSHEEQRVAKLIEANPTPAKFSVCHGNSCRLRTDISLSAAEWEQVRALFDPPPADARAERQQIAHATALLEILTGRQAGTLEDAPGMGVHWNPDGQLDCIDEATNSTEYLRMMAADGLIRFHDVGFPALDLVLTNSRDHTLARRIFQPREYLEPGGNLLNGIPAKAEMTIHLELDTMDLSPAGFRLDLMAASPP